MLKGLSPDEHPCMLLFVVVDDASLLPFCLSHEIYRMATEHITTHKKKDMRDRLVWA